MTLTQTPMPGRVLISVIKEDNNVTDSGIQLVMQQKEKPNRGRIVSIGTEDGSELGFGLKPGDVVVYARYGGHELTLNDEPHVILSTQDILLVERDQ